MKMLEIINLNQKQCRLENKPFAETVNHRIIKQRIAETVNHRMIKHRIPEKVNHRMIKQRIADKVNLIEWQNIEQQRQ